MKAIILNRINFFVVIGLTLNLPVHAMLVDFDNFADMTSINALNPQIIGEFEAIDQENSTVRFDDELPGEMSLRIGGFDDDPDALYRLPSAADALNVVFTDNANGMLDVTVKLYSEYVTLANINLFTPIATFTEFEPFKFNYIGSPILTIAFDTLSNDIQINEISFISISIPIPETMWLVIPAIIILFAAKPKKNGK